MAKITVKKGNLTEPLKKWLERKGCKIHEDPVWLGYYRIDLPNKWRPTCSIGGVSEIVDRNHKVRMYYNSKKYSIQICK